MLGDLRAVPYLPGDAGAADGVVCRNSPRASSPPGLLRAVGVRFPGRGPRCQGGPGVKSWARELTSVNFVPDEIVVHGTQGFRRAQQSASSSKTVQAPVVFVTKRAPPERERERGAKINRN